MLRNGICVTTIGSLKVSRVDQLHSMTCSNVIVIGSVVIWLFLVWLNVEPADENWAVRKLNPSVLMASDLHEPIQLTEVSVTEFPEIVNRDLSPYLAAVDKAVGELSFELESPETQRREPAPPASIPAKGFERWSVRYQPQSQQEYRNQLDSLGIDIGVVKTDSNDVFRITHVSTTPIARMSSRSAEAKTVYLGHVNRGLKRWDRALASQAGVDLHDSFIVHFLDPAISDRLLQLEEAFASKSGRKTDEILHTIFVVVKNSRGFEFEISQIEFRQQSEFP